MRYEKPVKSINASGYRKHVIPDQIDDADEKAENFTAESSDPTYKTTNTERAQGKNGDSSPYGNPCIPLDANS